MSNAILFKILILLEEWACAKRRPQEPSYWSEGAPGAAFYRPQEPSRSIFNKFMHLFWFGIFHANYHVICAVKVIVESLPATQRRIHKSWKSCNNNYHTVWFKRDLETIITSWGAILTWMPRRRSSTCTIATYSWGSLPSLVSPDLVTWFSL